MSIFDDLSEVLNNNSYRLDMLESQLKQMQANFDTVHAKKWNVEVEIYDGPSEGVKIYRTTTSNVKIDGRYLSEIKAELDKREEAISARERRAKKD